jgi:hypothetical protein
MAATAAETPAAGGGRKPIADHARRLWAIVPTPVIVTIVGALLSAWFIPAITRQWQDQQKARELKASLVTQINSDTTKALVTSDFIDYGRLGGVKTPMGAPPFPDRDFNQLDLTWRRDSEEIEAVLASYFPSIVPQWHAYASLVQNTYSLLRPRVYLRKETLSALAHRRIGTAKQRALLATPFTDLPAPKQRDAYYFVTAGLLDEKDAITTAVLHAHAAGYSQGPIDFLHDLLPFF